MKANFSSFIRFLDTLSPPKKAYAHCDIPCGVYESDSAAWAAETCAVITKKLLDLIPPDPSNKHATIEYYNTVTRMVMVKEEYAQICKQQLLILWTDYFKPEHIAKWPDLHDKFWKATKQCSIVKRSVNLEEANKLKTVVTEIAEIFKETKK